MNKLFTVYEGESVVAGLEKVTMQNAILAKMAPRVPLKDLDVDDTTFAQAGKEKYKVTRVQ